MIHSTIYWSFYCYSILESECIGTFVQTLMHKVNSWYWLSFIASRNLYPLPLCTQAAQAHFNLIKIKVQCSSFFSYNALCFHFTDGQHDKNSILSLLSKKDFGSFRQSVKREHVYTQFSGEKSLLHYTVASRDAESVEHVLSLGAEVNCTTARGYTPLIIAVLHRSV